MDAADPTAWTTDTFGKLGMSSVDAAISRVDKFGVFYPANPLIPSEWSDVVPGSQPFGVSQQRFLQISWHCMDSTGEKCRGLHIIILPHSEGMGFLTASERYMLQRILVCSSTLQKSIREAGYETISDNNNTYNVAYATDPRH
jgi:hypothetical protein